MDSLESGINSFNELVSIVSNCCEDMPIAIVTKIINALVMAVIVDAH